MLGHLCFPTPHKASASMPETEPLMPAASQTEPLLHSLLGFFEAGGPVVLILAGLSVLALTVGLAKLWQFRLAGLGDERAAERALARYRAGDGPGALAQVQQAPNPVAQAMVRALNGRRLRLPDAQVREEVQRFGNAELEELRSWFRLLEVIASLSPLLGLFGTVLGMIGAFQQLEAAGNQVNPAILSGGIWEALLTTAVGLAVAMPTLALLNWLERRVERTAHAMDRVVTAVFTVELAPAPAAPPGAPNPRSASTERKGPLADVPA